MDEMLFRLYRKQAGTTATTADRDIEEERNCETERVEEEETIFQREKGVKPKREGD